MFYFLRSLRLRTRLEGSISGIFAPRVGTASNVGLGQRGGTPQMGLNRSGCGLENRENSYWIHALPPAMDDETEIRKDPPCPIGLSAGKLIHRTTRGRWGLCDCGVLVGSLRSDSPNDARSLGSICDFWVLVILISRRRLAATSPMTFGRWNARSMATFDRNRERRPQRARLVGRESYPAKKNSPRH